MIFLETIAVAVGCALVAVGAHYVVQRRFDADMLAEHNEVAGYIYSAVAVTYAVVLGFVVVSAWEKYGQVQNYVSAEASAVLNLDHTVGALPQPQRRRIRTGLLRYAHEVVEKEWPEMRNGTLALSAGGQLDGVAREIESFAPNCPGEQDAHLTALDEMRRIFDARRDRILASQRSVPPILWLALIAGAIATLGFTFLFGVRNRGVQLLMTGVLAALIGIMFVVINEFDTPFQGANSIAPTGWLYLEERASTMELQ